MKVQIEILNYEDNCLHRTILAGKRGFKEYEAVINYPTIVLVVGKGVISKMYAGDDNIIQRVTGNDSLYWSKEEDSEIISFVRKEQIDIEIEKFSNVLSIKIASEVNDDLINKTIAEFYKEVFTIKNILKYDDIGKKVVSHLIKKIEIPLMISVFIILLTNFFVNSHFSEKNSKLQLELVNSRRIAKNIETQRGNESKLLSENLLSRDLETTIMIDKIASLSPRGVTLSSLSIDPLIRRLGTKKVPTMAKNRVIIKGETISANDITVMTNKIEKLDFAKNVKIKNIVQNRDDNRLEFELEITY